MGIRAVLVGLDRVDVAHLIQLPKNLILPTPLSHNGPLLHDLFCVLLSPSNM